MSGPVASPKTKAADLLFRGRVLPKAQFDRVVALVRESGDRAEEVLIDEGILSEADLLKALSAIYQTHFVSTEKLSKADIPKATVQMIPRRVAETLGVFPVLFDRQKSLLSIVTADPDQVDVLREIQVVSGAREVKAFVARPAAIAAAVRKHHGGDTRAFDRLERSGGGIAYDFGQQVTPDGRVMSARENTRAPSSHDHGSASRQAVAPPVPAQRAAPPPPPSRTTRATISQTIDDFDDLEEEEEFVAPKPLPKRKGRMSLSVPPPPISAPPPPSASGSSRDVASRPAPPSTSAGRAAATRTVAAYSGSDAPPTNNEAARQNVLQHDTTVELLTVLVSLLETSRQDLRGHSSQVARLLSRVSERMNLDRADSQALVIAGYIHDLGKMGQFHLTALNCAEYEGHRVAAQKADDTPLRLLEAVRLAPAIRNAVFHMYERVDGCGFPDKLVGKEIPLGARLLAVADTYADLTQNPRNPFRKALSPATAMEELLKHKGTIFDASILDLFKALVLGEDMKEKLLASRYSVLLVDSDPEESTILELRMVEQGFEVKTARTLAAARKLAQATTEGATFDLVVSELDLPDGDGLTFLADARKEAWGRDLPWVIHTQKQGRTEANRAFELGALDFVAKPVQAYVLVAKLKAILDQRSTGRSAKGVSGSLREMGLPDIVQVLFHGRKTGKLNVRSGGTSGEIHFLEGNIANAIVGDVSGAPAFYALLKFVDGDFALDPGFAPPKRVITDSSEALLLEGMRRMDEGI